jgi:hypothetical protein
VKEADSQSKRTPASPKGGNPHQGFYALQLLQTKREQSLTIQVETNQMLLLYLWLGT